MSQQITNIQALINLYAASTKAQAPLEVHEALKANALQVESALNELEKLKSNKKPARAKSKTQ